jgi:type VI secretion system protein ImpA
MPTPPVIDIDALLAPIPGDQPAGVPLRPSAPEFSEINKLLPQVDRAISEGIEGGKEGEWKKLIEKASQILKTRSKDLRVTGRLVQALVHQYGFPGLRDGLVLMRRLMEEFWEGLSPPPDEDTGDLEARVGPLVAMCQSTESPVWVREIPLANRKAWYEGDESKQVTANYNLYFAISNKDTAEDWKPYAASLNRVVAGTPPQFYRTMYEDLLESLEALEAFNSVADEKFGSDLAPPVTHLREAIHKVKNRVESIAQSKGIRLDDDAAEDTASEEVAAEEEVTVVATSNGSSNGHAGPIRTRAEALTRLREIADFLRKQEPHSPVSYLINRAIAWSEMPFDKLLLELVTDETVLRNIHTTLGIKPGDSSSGYGDSSYGDSSYNDSGYGDTSSDSYSDSYSDNSYS